MMVVVMRHFFHGMRRWEICFFLERVRGWGDDDDDERV